MLLLLTPATFADGIILAAPSVLPPDMPQQRALIVYRDGVEKLVVESSFRGEGSDFAWILPVPSAPIEIAKATPGLFTTLEFGLQPKVSFGSGLFFWALVFGVLLIIWGVSLLLAGRFSWLKLMSTGVLPAALFVYLLIDSRGHIVDSFKPMAMAGESLAVAGVTATEAARIGSYEVQTLAANTSTHLDEWLRKNGYRTFPKNGAAILDDYIRQGWKFVAAKLHREAGKFSRPHPLAVSFKTASPVYPMRLTQLAGSDLHLDLFVMATQQVRVDNMKTLYSDRFKLDNSYSGLPVLTGATFRARMALPSLAEIAGGDCVVTWLQADLSNAQLRKDIDVANAPDKPLRQTFYLSLQVKKTAWSNMILVAGIVCFAGAIVFTTRKTARARVRAVQWAFVLGTVLCLAAKAATYATMPPVEAFSLFRGLSSYDVQRFVENSQQTLAKMTRDEVDQYLRETFKGQINTVTGQPIAFEEIPGDFVVRSDDEGVFVLTFDESDSSGVGAPYQIRITPQQQPFTPQQQPVERPGPRPWGNFTEIAPPQ
ncbi:MAG TPA: DUF2330 domain-containing protein [Candidatus Bathyarchaeia archaeon]|nr:DUF2330 domain-containing protein [Candidatus Bathyarchaeia archaeon]